MPIPPAINVAQAAYMAQRGQQSSRPASAAPPAGSHAFPALAEAMTRAFPLVTIGIQAAFGGAAIASHLALPKFPLGVGLVGLATTFGVNSMVQTTSFDTRRSPASPTARLLAVTTSFGMAGVAIAAMVNKSLYLYPPTAWGGALQGAVVAVIPLALGSRSSPFSSHATRDFVSAYVPVSAWLEEHLRWPLYIALAASVVAAAATLPGANVLALAAASIGAVRTASQVLRFVGSQEMDLARGPAEAAIRLQAPLGLAAFLGMYAGMRAR